MKKLLLLSFLPLAAVAAPDLAALQRERATLERNFNREQQKIDQQQEQAMIKIRTQERDLRAQAERDTTAGVDVATYIMTSGAKGFDFDKLSAAKLATEEVSNKVSNQLTPEAQEPFQQQRSALERRRTLELAKLDAKMLGDAEGVEKARDLAIKQAELNARWQEKFDELEHDERVATNKLTFEHTTKINTLEAKLYVQQQKQAIEAQKKLQEETKAGKTPDMTAYTQMLTTPSAEAKELTIKRDEAKNALQTARDELSAEYNTKRTDLQNAREDELAKLSE